MQRFFLLMIKKNLSLFYILISFFIIVVQLQLSHLFLHYSPLSHLPTPTSTVSPHPIVHVQEYSIHVPFLAPSSSFAHYHSPPSPLIPVSLFFISMSLVLFSSFVCFVDQIQIIGEIIWYLSFTAWLISLSIMLSSSIRAPQCSLQHTLQQPSAGSNLSAHQ